MANAKGYEMEIQKPWNMESKKDYHPCYDHLKLQEGIYSKSIRIKVVSVFMVLLHTIDRQTLDTTNPRLRNTTHDKLLIWLT